MSKTLPKDTSTSTSIDDAPDVALDKASTEPVKTLAVSDVHGAFEGERVELIINTSPGEAGNQAVFVGVNGNGFNIPRDIKVNVPIEVLYQLDNATQTIYESIAGGGVQEREVKRFSYTAKILPKSA